MVWNDSNCHNTFASNNKCFKTLKISFYENIKKENS